MTRVLACIEVKYHQIMVELSGGQFRPTVAWVLVGSSAWEKGGARPLWWVRRALRSWEFPSSLAHQSTPRGAYILFRVV